MIRTLRARDLMRQIATAAWECADPGMQFDTTINAWHTSANTGRINGSNPCSEYMHLDNSACNLASLNLMKYLGDDGTFHVEDYRHAVEIMFTGQEILVGNADYPTEPIGETSRRFRQLGMGYANLGALLMAQGLPYDSEAGRAWAAAITALMCGHAYAVSARTAGRMGAHAGFEDNREPMLDVLRKHRSAVAQIDEELVPPDLLGAAQRAWDEAVDLGEVHGVRNAQATVLAPTGTIGLMMDCDTTGIEPDLALTKAKKLVGGGTMFIVNNTVYRALRRIGYGDPEADAIVQHINEHKTIVGAPGLRPSDLPVFACAMGDNVIHYMGHVKMMAAVQPFISGAISKTVNMPEEASVEDIEDLLVESWRLGLKAVAIYRDNCKVGQPLSTQKKATEAEVSAITLGGPTVIERVVERVVEKIVEIPVPVQQPVRQRLPRKRNSRTFSFRVADCHGYVTVGEFEDGRPGEVFLNVAKQGSTLAGIMDSFAISVSHGLQYGVPLEAFVEMFTNQRFEPAGMTDDPEIRFATSLVDYIFRRLAVEYLPYGKRAELGVLTVHERIQPTLPGVEEESTPTQWSQQLRHPELDEPVVAAEPYERIVPGPGLRGGDPAGVARVAGYPSDGRAGDLPRLRRPHEAGRHLPRLRVLRRHQRLQLTDSRARRRARVGAARRRTADGGRRTGLPRARQGRRSRRPAPLGVSRRRRLPAAAVPSDVVFRAMWCYERARWRRAMPTSAAPMAAAVKPTPARRPELPPPVKASWSPTSDTSVTIAGATVSVGSVAVVVVVLGRVVVVVAGAAVVVDTDWTPTVVGGASVVGVVGVTTGLP